MYSMDSSAQDMVGIAAGYGSDGNADMVGVETISMYRRLAWDAKVARVVGRLTGHGSVLRCIGQILAGRTISGRHSKGVRRVPVERIVGSEGRCQDFDRRFRPLKTHTDQRWYRVARARAQGVELPPVALIQIGDDYYVRDGHHRISVARALGDTDLDADVIEYDLAPRAAPALAATAPVARP